MNTETTRRIFDFHLKAIHMNLEGVGHEESLDQPEAGGNCINWVLGHIVATRKLILGLVKEELGWTEEEAAPYMRGSEPLRESKALPISRIVADLEASQKKLIAGLGETPPDEWSSPSNGETKRDTFAFLQFHEAYHIGQLGTLRRLLGKPGVIG
jgi:uncharacterized damage-inducible protein DinB